MASTPLSFPKPSTNADDDRRLEPRYGAEGEVTLMVFDPRNGTDMELDATLLDFSLHGLRIGLRHELPAGQEVRVLFSWGEASTQVMWTSPLGNAFQSGLQLF